MHHRFHHWVMPVGGLLPLLVLRMLYDKPRHGYQLEEDLSKILGRQIPEGFIYGLLRRLEVRGLVTYTWEMPTSGPARKVYKLTDEGKEYLILRLKSIISIKQIIDYLLKDMNNI
ncbi:MAG: PadR family transcriptional regulator [Thermoprotei archaeon]